MKKTIVILLLIFCSNILYGYQAEDIYLSNWKTYTNTTYIHQIFCKGDSVVAATWGGISIFNKKDSTFSTLVKSDGLSKNEVRSVHYIPSIDEFWFGSYLEGINRYKNGKFLKPYQGNQGVVGNYINDIDDNDKYIFLGTDEGLTMFEIMEDENPAFKKTFIYKEDGSGWLSDNNVNCITFDDSNRIWVGTNQGLDYTITDYDEMTLPDNWHHINNNTTGYPFAEEKITCIDYYDGKIYFGTEDGFAIINKIYSDSLEFNEFIYNLPTRKISSILATDDSTVWVGFGKWNETDQRYDSAKGVGRYNLLNSEDYQVWDEDDSLFNQISDIKKDSDGNIWVSTWEDGLYCYKDGFWGRHKPNCINSNLVTIMMIDSNQNLWCGFGTKYPITTPHGTKGLSKFDGEKWTNFRNNQSSTDSSLWSDRIFRMCEDKNGNKWFGTWGHGLGVLNTSETEWTIHNTSNTDWMLGNQVSILECDKDGNMWIGAYSLPPPGGMTILMPDNNRHQFVPKFTFYESGHNYATMWATLLDGNKVWLGCLFTGIQYWDTPGFPETDGLYWHQFAGSEGLSCFDFDIQRTDYGNYIFAGCEDGLYMYDDDWDDWYKFTNSNVKEYYWDGGEWQRCLYYWIDEEGNQETRLGSGISNQINAVFVDPHGRKWLATNGGGISVLDRDNYSFTNFNTENSPLCSDFVLSFAYNPYTGELFAGTSAGLCSFNIGVSKKDESLSQTVKKVSVFPNPFKPAEHKYIYFQAYPNDKLPTGKNRLYIYNLSGELVTIREESDRSRFFWNGKNKAGKPVASGIYFYVLSSEFDNQYIVGKFAVIR